MRAPAFVSAIGPSAFLLFSLELRAGRLVLPVFGGAPRRLDHQPLLLHRRPISRLRLRPLRPGGMLAFHLSNRY